MTPRTAFTSRDDQPVLLKIVRSVFFVAWVRDGGVIGSGANGHRRALKEYLALKNG